VSNVIHGGGDSEIHATREVLTDPPFLFPGKLDRRWHRRLWSVSTW